MSKKPSITTKTKSNLKVSKTVETKPKHKHSPFKKLAIFLSIYVAGLMLIFGNIFFWTGNTLINTDKYMATVSPIIEQPVVQTAIATYATNQIFSAVDVNKLVTDALPPKAEFLAPSITTQVKNYTGKTAQAIVSSKKFQTTWNTALENNHARIINFLKTYKGDGNITISSLYQKISSDLTGTKLSILANRNLPPKIGQITLIQASWLPYAHNIVVNLHTYQVLTTSLFIILVLLAVILSKNKAKVLKRISFLFAILMAVTIVAIKLSINTVSSSVDPIYQPAVKLVEQIVTKPLLIHTWTLFGIFLVIGIVSWIFLKQKYVDGLKDFYAKVKKTDLHHALFAKENKFTTFLGDKRKTVIWAFIILFTVILLILGVSLDSVVQFSLGILLLLLVLEVLQNPKKIK